MKLYLKNGYVDMSAIIAEGFPFTFVVGGRGTGKTYGALKTVKDGGRIFMLMRRSKTQTDIISQQEFSPFKSVCMDDGDEMLCRSVSKHATGYFRIRDGVEDPLPCGYLAPLSTFANLRGFDSSEIDIMVFDEFIPESHERKIKDEAKVFFNAYETINRNRELTGRKPLQAVLLSNSNLLANDYFLELGLVGRAQRMSEKGIQYWADRQRGILLVILNDSPISALKADTALYRALGGSDFQDMSLGNKFSDLTEALIRPRPLAEYSIIASWGEISIYKHKSQHTFYVSEHRSGTPDMYGTGDTERKRFIRKYSYLWQNFLMSRIDFESYLCYALFLRIFE